MAKTVAILTALCLSHKHNLKHMNKKQQQNFYFQMIKNKFLIWLYVSCYPVSLKNGSEEISTLSKSRKAILTLPLVHFYFIIIVIYFTIGLT